MSELRRPIFSVWVFFLIMVRLVAPLLISSGLLAAVLRALDLSHLPSLAWVVGFPLLYLIWLHLYLITCCVETWLFSCFVRKPETCTRRVNTVSMMTVAILGQYARCGLIRSLPLAWVFMGIIPTRSLVLRAYAAKLHVSLTSTLGTIIQDPDSTYIGAGTIIGGNVELVAHSYVRQLNDDLIYKAAPIHIGKNVTIGGDSRVALGATVGDGAVVEPCSNVVPYSKIGPGEVWGGNPAVFIRQREGVPSAASPVLTPEGSSTAADVVLPVIAHALNVPPAKLTAETKMADVVEWDSLGKLAIAAALHDRFGLKLEPEQVFELDSVPHVLSFLGKQKKPLPEDEVESEEDALPRNMELLPLLNPISATTALASHDLPEPIHDLRICIAATTVAEPVAPTLQLWCRAFGVRADIIFAGFNQVQACLLQPESIFFQNRAGLNVAIVCPEDLAGASEGDLTIRAQQLLDAIGAFAQQSTQPLWVTDLPPLVTPDPTITAKELNSVRALWSETLAANPRIHLLPFASIIEELGLIASANPAGVTNTRYSALALQRLAIEISRAARVFHLPPRKVLALDADDTLWEGIVAEDGQDVKIGPLQRQLQTQAKAFQEKGGLLVLLSRNEPEDVWAVWEQQKEMLIKREDFAAVRVNWKTKSANLMEIADELNLGLDSFVFVDDNPGERIDVESRCPGVLTIPAPTPGSGANALGRLWCFDRLAVTAEDLQRTDLIQQESRRREAAQNSEGDYERYLQTLNLQVNIRQASSQDLPRVVQLIQKTNQFNVSLRRRTQGELEQLGAEYTIWTISARDRFGDYGLIGVGILSREADSSRRVTLDSFLLSCRALGRGIEVASLGVLCETAARAGANSLQIPFVTGPRNRPALDFLDQHGWKIVGATAGELSLPVKWTMPAHLRLVEKPPQSTS